MSRLLEAPGAPDSAGSHRLAHGGELVDLLVSTERAAELKSASSTYPSWDLTDRQVCDLELLMNGAFSPLRGFLGREAYNSVCSDMRLPDGTIWPMPVVLDLTDEAAASLHPGDKLALRDSEGVMLAVLNVEELYQPDREVEAQQVFGTTDPDHPGVAMLLKRTNPVYVGGSVEGIQLPTHYDFAPVRMTPRQVRSEIARQGWTRVVAFQTRNPMHRAHQELTLRAAASVDAKLLIHPVVGMTKPGDVDHYTRVRCYEAMLGRYPEGTAMLSLLPLAMRMGGPREAVWHAIIRKNYGCTHLIVGRDHAGPGKRRDGTPFYGPYEAQEVLGRYADEIGIGMVAFQMLVYVAERDEYFPEDEVPKGLKPLNISGTELRERLAAGAELPSWFTYPEVARELRRTHRPRLQQGFTVFFTGLSGSGKSTIANVLQVKLLERGGRSLMSSTATSYAGISRRSWASHASTATSTSAESAMSPPRSPRPAASPSALPSRLMTRLESRFGRWSSRTAASSLCTLRPPSTSARQGTARVCMPRRAPGSSRSSPASPIRTRSRMTLSWWLTLRTLVRAKRPTRSFHTSSGKAFSIPRPRPSRVPGPSRART